MCSVPPNRATRPWPRITAERSEGLVAPGRLDVALRVLGQQQALADERVRRSRDLGDIAGMIAIEFLERGARIAAFRPLRLALCQRCVTAVAVAQLALGERRLVGVPARVCCERRGDVRE